MWRATTTIVVSGLGLTGCGRIGFDARIGLDAADFQNVQLRCEQSDGLVAYWPFDENAGSLAADISGSQQTATLAGNTSWVAGQIGSALHFDGPTDFAFVAATPALGFAGGGGSFSLSYWLSPLSLTNAPDIRPFEIALCAGTGYIFLYVYPDGSAGTGLYDHVRNYGISVSLPGALQLGRWTHVVHVLDRGAASGQTYVDGSPSGSPINLSALTGVIDCSGTDSTTFGGWSGTFNYQGSIDDVRVFDRTLTAQEVQDLSGLSATDCPW